jgi:hypothetical protein
VTPDGTPKNEIARPVKLEKHHDLDAFECGADELDTWLKKYAWANHATGNAKVFVATRGSAVVGCYTLSSAGVAKDHLPSALTTGGAPAEIPCLLLGRMAVNRADQGAQLGRSLLIDALLRIARLSEDVGIRALVIHCRDDDAKRWYQHQARTFQASPIDPLHLFLPIKDLRRLASDG